MTRRFLLVATICLSFLPIFATTAHADMPSPNLCYSGSGIPRIQNSEGLWACKCVIDPYTNEEVCAWVMEKGSIAPPQTGNLVGVNWSDIKTLNSSSLGTARSAGGESSSWVTTYFNHSTWAVHPAGWLAVSNYLYVWSGSAWAYCRDSGFSYNPAAAFSFGATVSWGSTQPCGPGYYGNWGGSWRWNGSGWVGGWNWSDYIYNAVGSPLAVTQGGPQAGNKSGKVPHSTPSHPRAIPPVRPDRGSPVAAEVQATSTA